MRRISVSLLTLVLLLGLFPLAASADQHIFTKTMGFATKTGYRGVFSWEATQPVDGLVHFGTNPSALDQTTRALPGAPDTAQMAIAEGLTVGSTVYWQVEDLLTGELSDVSSFKATNAYTDWNGSTYTLDLLVQIDTQSLPPGVPADLALQNVAQGINIFGERLYDAMDGFARLGNVLITDTNLDYGTNVPFSPPGCFTGLSNAADVLIESSVPFDSHTYAGWSIDDPCISFYVGRLGQLVVPWGMGGSEEDLHFGYVATHEMMHYAFNAPDLYDPADVNNPRVGGCWNLGWDGSLMHNDGGWVGDHWEFTELDRNPALTPCDHSDSASWTWDALRESGRYTNVPLRPAGPIEHMFDNQARGNADGGAMNIQILDREPASSTLSGFTANDMTIRTDKCTEPGQTVLTDVSYDSLDTVAAHDLQWAAVAEPFERGAGKVVFTLKVQSLSDIPPNTTWPLFFRDPNGISRWVRMSANAAGQVSFAHGLGSNANPYFSSGTPALEASSYDEDGTIRIVLDRTSVGLAPGQALTQFISRVRIDSPDGGANGATPGISPDNMPNDTTAPAGIYTSVGSENCLALPPVANDDNATTAEDTFVDVAVLANDTDPEGRSLLIESVSAPGNGTATIAAGKVRYTPNANFNGNDSFTYAITTPAGGTDSATVNITVTSSPDAPTAFDDRLTITSGTSFRIPVLDNDSDLDGDTLSVISATDPPKGTAQANADGTVRYTPDSGTSGTDTFSYTVSDGALTDTAAVVVQVLPVGAENPCVLPGVTLLNDPANDQTPGNSGAYDINKAWAGGLFPNGQIVFTVKVAGPLNPPPASSVWRVRFTANGTIYYVSMETLDLLGVPVFRYGSVAGSLLTDLGPADSGTFTQEGYITIGIRASKLGLLAPGNTLSTINAQTQRYVGAEGNGGFLGVDSTSNASFTVAACLQEPPNDPPSAADDQATTNEDSAASINVLANDTDRNGDRLSITAFGQGTNGSVSSAGGVLTYTPFADYFGDDSFTYTISDGRLTASAIVHVTVDPVNDLPIPFDDAATTDEDSSVVVNAVGNDTDPDGDILSVGSVSSPVNGIASVNPDGTITYRPNANYNGQDVFSYEVSDGQGGLATAQIVITVSSVNDPPVAVDDAVECRKNRAVTFSALINDSDVEDGGATVVSVSQGKYGTTRINNDGSITYSTTNGYTGSDSFTYTISDSEGATDTGLVVVTLLKPGDGDGKQTSSTSATLPGIGGLFLGLLETIGLI